MPIDQYTNNASTTVATAATAVAAGTTQTWTVGSTASFPAASSTASPATWFTVVDPAAQTELIRVTNVAGTTWTVIRGVEGTTPVSHTAGYTVVNTVTSGALMKLSVTPSQALRRWSAALAGAATTPVDILCIGDSITEGANSTTLATRWTDQMREQLRALIPVPGVSGGLNYLPVRYVTTTFPASMAVSGAPAQSSYGLGARSYDLTTTTPVLTATVTGTGFRVYYVRSATVGVASYSIDGATAVTFTTSTGNLGRIDTQASTAIIPFATRGTHTVALKYVSGGTATFEGLVVYDGDETKGVRVWEGGYYGLSTSNIVTNIALGLYGFDDRITAIQPAAVVIQFGTNDCATTAGNLSSATYKTNMLSIIAHVKSACTIAPSIVLMAMYRPNVTFVEPWGNYVQVLYDIAAADPTNVCVLDLTPRFPPVSGDVLGLYSDAIHPSDTGQTSIGATVANFLTVDERVAATLRRAVSRLTAAATNTTVTYASTGLSVNVAPNQAYTFRAQGQYRTAATTTGIGFRINTTATVTGLRYTTMIWGATSASVPVVVVGAANLAANLTTAVLAATTDYAWEIEGVLRAGAAGGTLTVEFASEVAASTVTVQPDSVLYADPA